MGRFPILMYHRIVSPRCPIPEHDRKEEAPFAVSLEAFVEQIALPPIGRVARPVPHEPGPGRFWRR